LCPQSHHPNNHPERVAWFDRDGLTQTSSPVQTAATFV
jgi:hypothetical protein